MLCTLCACCVLRDTENTPGVPQSAQRNASHEELNWVLRLSQRHGFDLPKTLLTVVSTNAAKSPKIPQ
jgi:hypothetical protein